MSRGKTKKDYLTPAVGWLFADLLLAIAMLFLFSAIPSKEALQAKGLPTPTASATHKIQPIPKPTVDPNVLVLDSSVITLKLTVDEPDALSNGDKNSQNALIQSIKKSIIAQKLQNRRAGIVLAYGGAGQTTDGIGRAQRISEHVYAALAKLGKERFVFCKTVQYGKLYILGTDPQTVTIDIFFFNKSAGGCSSIAP